MIKKVIITGAMGFIGSHTAKVFKEAGYHVTGIDRIMTIPQAVTFLDQLCVDDFAAITPSVAGINNVDAIVHCAGTSLVGPSIANPGEYYTNNVAKTNQMLDLLQGWKGTIVFSSSAATYGVPLNSEPLLETDPQSPISPYGYSKLFCERVIQDHCTAHGIKGVALRYFNACGCDPDNMIGHVADDSHMIPRVLSSYQKVEFFNLYGDDYNTADGTCIRDYLHVMDIAQAHLKAVELADTMQTKEFRAYNLGTGTGISNKEIIAACNRAVNDKIDFRVAPRRTGDPDYLVADSTQFRTDTNWKPVYSDIDTIVNTTWAWQKTLS